MTCKESVQFVVAHYPADLQPHQCEPLSEAGGFSGARLWWLDTPRGPACLRRWPKEHPTRERLEFIQAVLWHADQEGFHLVPVPFDTKSGSGYIYHDEHFWELTPWMPGCADYHGLPCPKKLRAAMTALAEFHLATVSFPLAEAGRIVSPGITERSARFKELCNGGVKRISERLSSLNWPELQLRGRQLCELFRPACEIVHPHLRAVQKLETAVQPCIRDIWHDHVLFQGTTVTGIIDFGAMRAENVAADVARLLGSMVQDDEVSWHIGLSAYQSVRPLSEEESLLVTAFDRTTVLMAGMQWLDWIFCQGRHFEDREAVTARIDEITARLVNLVQRQ